MEFKSIVLFEFLITSFNNIIFHTDTVLSTNSLDYMFVDVIVKLMLILED